ncbi:MAG: ABC transporter permease [Ruminococcus sp.]|nr:ABC transporter permease [Ruminococcus sp.]
MKKFLYLQLKRMLKFLPFVLIVVLCLLIGLSAFLTGITSYFTESEDKKPITIGLTGDTGDDYMQLGMAALKTLDDTRFTINLEDMTEEEAEKRLSAGKILAYVVFPENFIENALSGSLEKVRYVTTSGAGNVTTLFKNEICKVITNIMIYSEKGTYAIAHALSDNAMGSSSWDTAFELTAQYIKAIIDRSDVYRVEELGFSSGLDIIEYFVCGITVLLLFLMGLPYAIIHIKKDYALNRLLLSRGHSCISQLMCEFISHLSAMLILVITVFSLLFIGGNTISGLSAIINNSSLIMFLIRLLPVVIMLSAFNIMCFELSDNIIGGMLIHFFVCLSMCYVAGCMYPIYTFPVIIQKLSVFLPTGMATNWLSDNFTNNFSFKSLIGLVAYIILFLSVALIIRKRKTENKQKGVAR